MVKAMLIGTYPRSRTIAEMTRGEIGYTVPWAYNPETHDLDTSQTIGEKGGTAHMRVKRTRWGSYVVEVEGRY